MFFCQSQDEFRTKESEFVSFTPFIIEGQIWLGIDMKGNVKVDYDASIYGEMLFIFITKKASKYFSEWWPKNFENQSEK